MGHQARTNNSEEQEQAKAKCGGPSTDHPNEQVRSSGTPVAAAKYAASGRDDDSLVVGRDDGVSVMLQSG
jgi:hypothetical protein